MSETMITDFTVRANALSYEDTLSVISILIERLKKSFGEEKENDAHPSFLAAAFEIADKNAEIHKSEEKWTRDELYRY